MQIKYSKEKLILVLVDIGVVVGVPVGVPDSHPGLLLLDLLHADRGHG